MISCILYIFKKFYSLYYVLGFRRMIKALWDWFLKFLNNLKNIQRSIFYNLTNIRKNIFKYFFNSHSGILYFLKHNYKNYMNSCKLYEFLIFLLLLRWIHVNYMNSWYFYYCWVVWVLGGPGQKPSKWFA